MFFYQCGHRHAVPHIMVSNQTHQLSVSELLIHVVVIMFHDWEPTSVPLIHLLNISSAALVRSTSLVFPHFVRSTKSRFELSPADAHKVLMLQPLVLCTLRSRILRWFHLLRSLPFRYTSEYYQSSRCYNHNPLIIQSPSDPPTDLWYRQYFFTEIS